MRTSLVLVAVAVAAGILSSEVGGATTVYEGFVGYANDADILTVNAGAGFTNPWQPGNSVVGGAEVPNLQSVRLLSESLFYRDANGNVLQTAGGSMFLTGEFGSTSVARTYDQGALPNAAPPSLGDNLGQTTYLSFLARRSGPAADPTDPIYGGSYPWGDNLFPRVAGVTMWSNDGGDQVPLLIGNLSNQDQDVWRLAGQDLDDQNPPPFVDQPFGEGANTYFVVMRVDHEAGDGDGDQIHFYLNPILQSETLNTANLIENWEADDDPLYLPGDWLSIQAGDASGNRPFAEFTFDEYRIGASWNSVTPHTAIPEPTSLMAVSLAIVFGTLRLFRARA